MAGNCPTWVISSGAVSCVRVVTEASGTSPDVGERVGPDVLSPALPLMPGRYIWLSDPMSCWKAGVASRITRYWLDCVNMVEIWRWPKLSYSTLSMVWGVMEYRAPVVRSRSTCATSPAACRSDVTSDRAFSCCSRAMNFGTHVVNWL
ncbi:hypothetical protein MSKU3_1190 [Komagataeibacter oboediens]|nr:hypothetical protein MSKU3_1190 [Komagataeibacter oboediens]